MNKSLMLGIGILLCACAKPATAKEELVPFEVAERVCLAEALFFEAGNQPLIGMIAVGEVITNRIKSDKYPDTICEVVHQGPVSQWWLENHNKKVPIRNQCQFSYYCDGKVEDTYDGGNWDDSVFAAVLTTGQNRMIDITSGATHYHANYVSPYWSKVMTRTVTIEDHLFYKP